MRRLSGAVLTVAASLVLHLGLGTGALWLGKHPTDAHVQPAKTVFVGETFDIAPLATPTATPEVEQPVPEQQEGYAPAPRRAHVERRGAGAPAPLPLTFGAVGDRTASSIIVTLTHGFPQAASTDLVWRTVPLGDAGSATMEVELNDDGTVARWNLGPGASPALRQAMVRTMALVGGRSFVATGAVTKLHVEARVTTDAVREGTDAVYAIHSEHEGDRGSAYFSLSIGRRVDLAISTLK